MSFPKNSFSLKKLYADCIDEEGNCIIVYHAILNFHFLRFYYSSLIFSDSTNRIIERSTFNNTKVHISADEMILIQKSLKLEGIWKNQSGGILLHLYKDSHDKELIWNCHHPKTLTEINYKGFIYKGLGYAETLTLYFNPWKLPIDKLYWGRYLSSNDTIIWIQWKGVFPLNKLFYNSLEYNDALIEDNIIVFGKGEFQLAFSKISTIRKGKLSQVLNKMPWLKALFKRSILGSIENKYKARSVFSRNNDFLSEGWSLYESVIWKY
jgi:hypothetical protein